MKRKYYEYIGKKIRNARKLRNMTQQDVADRLGITRSLYSQYERGACSITLKTWIELAEILDLNMDIVMEALEYERSNFS
ncbi:MAG: helix-turn-helix transcriptional regulator [Eubacterium sp.]|nr:helix-turn-helix transcriptional regulator [Eubacterium sp.]